MLYISYLILYGLTAANRGTVDEFGRVRDRNHQLQPAGAQEITVRFENTSILNVQDSMLKKLFLARVINTGLMIFLVTKYSEMMDFKTLNQVCVARSFRGDDPPLSR